RLDGVGAGALAGAGAPAVEAEGDAGRPQAHEVGGPVGPVEGRRMRDLDLVPEALEEAGGVLGSGDALGRHDGEAAGGGGEQPDAEAAGVGADFLAAWAVGRGR